VLATALLASCRLDVGVVVQLGADGTGDVTLTATADAEVVEQAPGLAADLRFDDARAAGWTVEGPTPTEEGGLTVVLRHPVASAQEATNVLASLGPPFADMHLERTVSPEDEREATVTLTGRLQLPGGGFDAFADSELISAAGGVPFADELTASGATPATSMSVRLRAELPGEVVETTGEHASGGLEWDAPLDGSNLDVLARTEQRPPPGGSWARPLASISLVLLVAWIALSVAAIVVIARARRRRQLRRPPVRPRV
jgi:hypothetical protein